MNIKRPLAALTLISASVSGFANAAYYPSFDYVETGYQANFNGNDVDGFVLNFSKQINNNWYVKGTYSQTSGEETGIYTSYLDDTPIAEDTTLDVLYRQEYDFSRWQLGGGYIMTLSDATTLDFSAQLGQVDAETDVYYFPLVEAGAIEGLAPYRTTYDNGQDEVFTLEGKIRHSLTEHLEVNAGIGLDHIYGDIDERNNVISAGAVYTIYDGWALSALVRHLEDYNDYSVSIRYNF